MGETTERECDCPMKLRWCHCPPKPTERERIDALLRARLREVPKGRWKVATSPNVVGLFVVTDGESIVFVAYTEAQARAVANALNLGEEP